jgi:hypothetical protein
VLLEDFRPALPAAELTTLACTLAVDLVAAGEAFRLLVLAPTLLVLEVSFTALIANTFLLLVYGILPFLLIDIITIFL